MHSELIDESHKSLCFYKTKCQIHLSSNFTPTGNSTPWRSIALNYEWLYYIYIYIKTKKTTLGQCNKSLLSKVCDSIDSISLFVDRKGVSIHLLVALPVGCLYLLGHSLLSFRVLPREGTVVLWAGFGCFSARLWLQPKSIFFSDLNISVGLPSLSTISSRDSQECKKEKEQEFIATIPLFRHNHGHLLCNLPSH